ncbi:UPF0496 protein-like protein [Salvia divinorum]|uniref:UPF0496 protein-like protein n=1 Tax=Salvia divinorum TaxID=28513 RepID=A0ABD1HXA9_SALDI
MIKMRKIICSKLKLSFANNDSHRKEEYGNTLTTKPNVKEEYKEAFRTKSYIEISDKVECHLMKATTHDEVNLTADSTPSPPPPFPPIHLPPYSSASTSDFNHFFANYFEITLEASRICESLLTNINQARKNHLRVKKAIKRISAAGGGTDELYHLLLKNLAFFAAQRNPFSATSPERFLDLRENHVAMLQELTSTCKKLKRRTTSIKLVKKSLAGLVLMGLGALVAVALAHCTAGLAVAPALALLALIAKRVRRLERRCDERRLEGLADVAARGVFIMINDFATMRMIVKRLEDEIEHRRFVADVCVRKGKKETLREVVREFQVHESCFVEQLEELERQICLCFLDIDRSKRLLVREMVK